MGTEVTQIACGRCHVLVYLSSNSRLYSFGLGANGQLGIGKTIKSNKLSPTLVKIRLANINNKIDDVKLFLFLFFI
jgi:alpha-tubulin suppressor-like RCC1 family protein